MFDLKEAIIFIGILSFIVFFIITIIRIVATIFYKYTIKKYIQSPGFTPGLTIQKRGTKRKNETTKDYQIHHQS